MGGLVNLWLDDMRPAPEGWVHAKTVDEAKAWIKSVGIERMSLDHDLGACPECLGDQTPEEWLAESYYQNMPHCSHYGTGYDLVCWMEETGHWPLEKPTVHSANPAGAARMRQVIDKHYEHADQRA